MTKYIKTVDEAYAEVQENQVKLQEPLSPNAKAGDYIKDFRKSDAPQFKGKSEKQRDKMAVAAYLDSKKEGIDEASLGHVVTFKPKDQDETFTTAFKTEKLAKEFAKEKETIGDKILSINEIEIPYEKYMLMVKEKFEPGFAVRYLDPLNKKRFVVPFKTKKEADDKAAQLKRDGCKNITITKHDLNFKDPILKKEQNEATMVSDISGITIPNLKKEAKKKNIKVSKVSPGGPMGADYEVTFTGSEKDLMRYAKEHLGFEGRNFRDLKKHLLNMGEVKEEVESSFEISGVENNGREVIEDDREVLEENKTKYERYTGVKNPYTEGRRSHYDTDDEDEEGANKNIIMQLRKSLNLRNRYDVVFDDGKKVKVKEPVARAAIAKWDTFRLSRDRLTFQNKIAKSYRDLLNAIKR